MLEESWALTAEIFCQNGEMGIINEVPMKVPVWSKRMDYDT